MGINIFFVFYVYEIDWECVIELCDFFYKDFLWFKYINNKYICNCKFLILMFFFIFKIMVKYCDKIFYFFYVFLWCVFIIGIKLKV